MGRRPKRKQKYSSDRERSLGFDRIRIEDESKALPARESGPGPERALLVGICQPGQDEYVAGEHLDELEMLARTAGAEVGDRELVKLRRRDPATYVGKGKAVELAEIARHARADLVIFDEDLAPAQTRNLEQVIGQRIVERSGLILDIFARRAQTREARTQVELAQMRYMLPRLSGAWTHLERQRGGIGLRGPGETQIETDRRILRTRIRTLQKELDHIARTHETQRAGRSKTFRFALAGYTNVGKSTLMNDLTQAGVYEENLLFATLDSTTRTINLGGRQDVLISDTVGFIRKLPPDLVASFRSTLAEIREADCILHVIDLASPSFREQKQEVEQILNEMKVGTVPRINVFNKLDAVEDDQIVDGTRHDWPEAVMISARRGIGRDALLDRMRQAVTESLVTLDVSVPGEDGKLLADLYDQGEVLETTERDGALQVRVRLTPEAVSRLGLTRFS